MDQIEQILNSQNPQVGELAARARRVVLSTLPPGVVEVPQPEENAVAFGFDTPRGRELFAWVGLFADHVTLGFYNGERLNDPAGLLKGDGAVRRVDFTEERMLDDPALRQLIQDAFPF
jgi:hypothetical protein